ncbi:MAG TPA: serine hydrolase [Puia sp.]|nr:serine hydrolase [Puia sp.]
MTHKITAIALSLFLGACSIETQAQQASVLPRSIPEKEGVSSSGISRFLDAAAGSKDEFHSFVFLRHGKIIAEGWWNPYKPALHHTLYSVSKSFTSTAIGFAVSENRLSVHDKVISFFPQDLPDTIAPNLSALTVQDLLDMSEGQDPEPTGRVITGDSNWVRSFLAIPVVHRPGTQFLYNSLGVYILAAIVQKVTGQTVVDYLAPRLFQPLGITDADWEVSPQGISTGGWGLRLKTEDLAKVGQLYLQKGSWQGRPLLPAKWIEEATNQHIDQVHDSLTRARRDSSDWLQGYGYLFWRCRHHAYRADGAFGQYIIVMPDQDAVLAITSETSDMQDELNLVWKYLLPAMQKDPLPAAPKEVAALQQRLTSLALPPLPAAADAQAEAGISGKTYPLAPNSTHITGLSFSFKDHLCQLSLQTDSATYPLSFGSGKWVEGTTTLHGPHLTSAAKASLTGLPPFRTAGSYRWKDTNTLELALRFIESPHTQTFECHFDSDKMSVTIYNSFDFAHKGIALHP